MHPSFRAAHRPLISFIGKRKWPPGSCRVLFAVCVPTQYGPGPQPQRPHPAAPAQLKETFSDFLKKYNSPSPSSGRNPQKNSQRLAFKDFWEAPTSLWRPRIRQLEDAEIDAVLVS
jgi:small subunit ribosomal protein YMR-31